MTTEPQTTQTQTTQTAPALSIGTPVRYMGAEIGIVYYIRRDGWVGVLSDMRIDEYPAARLTPVL